MRFTFHFNKNIKQTYKGDLHFTVICCTNKCIINERYIPEHQNKLNIYDLQNYDFFANFFQYTDGVIQDWGDLRGANVP